MHWAALSISKLGDRKRSLFSPDSLSTTRRALLLGYDLEKQIFLIRVAVICGRSAEGMEIGSRDYLYNNRALLCRDGNCDWRA